MMENLSKVRWAFDSIGGEIVKEDDRYVVRDNKTLNNLILSSTDLEPGKQTSGHKHEGQEEIYFFIRGGGKMRLDDEEFYVREGDIILIEDGVFHQVINISERENLYFVCVFDGSRNH